MAGLVFYFEDNDRDVWSGRNLDFDAWNYLAQIPGDITKIRVINKTQNTYDPFNEALDVEYLDALPDFGTDHVTQLVCPWEPVEYIELWDFDHNTDWYVLGPANGWGGNHFGDQLVSVPQYSNVACHAIHIATVAMAHRYKVKG